jgi:hypothetical protein
MGAPPFEVLPVIRASEVPSEPTGTCLAPDRVVKRAIWGRRRIRGTRAWRRARIPRAATRRSPFGDLWTVRRAAAIVALGLGMYCLILAATALYAQPAAGDPNPAELAERDRYEWPGLIPVMFLALVAGYAMFVAARRSARRRRSSSSPPSTQDPPREPSTPAGSRRDTTSH